VKLMRLTVVGLVCWLVPMLVLASEKRTRSLTEDETRSTREPEQAPTPRRMPTGPGTTAPITTAPIATAPAIVVGGVEGPECCGWDPCCGGDGPLSRLWVSAELLLWWMRANNTPPLVTTGTPTSLGVLGLPGTRVLAGGDLDQRMRVGGRFTVGYWFDDCRMCGIEGSYFFLGSDPKTSTFASSGDPILGRPFFNVSTGREDAQQVANPILPNPTDPSLGNLFPLTGQVSVQSRTRLWGAEVNGVRNLVSNECHTLDLLGGFRYLDLDDRLSISEELLVPPNSPVFANTQFSILDDFTTRNQFYGGQLGLRGRIYRRNWTLDVFGKLALGGTHQTVNINGSTRIRDGQGVATSSSGGLLALPSNIGRYERDQFAVVPELGFTLGYNITSQLRVTVGYNFIYWSDVVRPGEIIDRAVNPNLLPDAPTQTGAARPAFTFAGTDFFAQGLTFGIDYRW
jgi:hypothetical protein